MPNFSRPRYLVLDALDRRSSQSATLQDLLRVLGIGENYTPTEYLRVHRLMSRLNKAGLVSRAKNARHGLTLYNITPEGNNALGLLREKYFARQQQVIPTRAFPLHATNEPPAETTSTVQEATIVKPLPPPAISIAASSSLDVVRCPRCNVLIPGKEVRHALYVTGTIICPKCKFDLTDTTRGPNFV
jgi:DNA-binding PadR family transcriptional regulator